MSWRCYSGSVLLVRFLLCVGCVDFIVLVVQSWLYVGGAVTDVWSWCSLCYVLVDRSLLCVGGAVLKVCCWFILYCVLMVQYLSCFVLVLWSFLCAGGDV